MKRFLYAFLVLGMSVSFLSGCGKPQEPRLAGSGGEVNYTPEETLKMKNYKFSPSVIKAKAGENLIIKIESTEGTHNFIIDELGVESAVLGDGDSETFNFMIPEDAAGKEFEFYCGIADHKILGMVGTLVVK